MYVGSRKKSRSVKSLPFLALGLLLSSGCADPAIHHSDGRDFNASQPNGTPSSPGATSPDPEFPEAIAPGPMGTVYEFDGYDLPAENVPVELKLDAPFRQLEIFYTGDDPVLEVQFEIGPDLWTDWQVFVPDATYAGSYAGIITLETPATAMRYRTQGMMDQLYLELFEQALELPDHAHDDHAHDDDTPLADDPDYGDLSDASIADDELEVRTDGLTQRQQGLITSCEKRRMAAYSDGTRLADIDVIEMDGKNVGVNTGSAYEKMRIAAARSGVHLRIVSGFRTMPEQEYLYNCYRTKRCNRGNLAARPGYSNHQNGLALDLNTKDRGVLRWLNANGANYGFRRTVRSEPWHWEYTAGRTVDPQVCNDGSSEPAENQDPGPQTSTTTCSETQLCTSTMDCVDGQCAKTGKLRVTLTWQDRIDLDLHVVTPSGAKLWYRDRDTADGGIFDSDSCIGTTCQGDSFRESVYWRGEPTEGHYTFWAVNYTGDRQAALTFDLSINGERKTFQSTVPAARNGESVKFMISYPDGAVIEP
jgi:hypothetical protein